MKEFKIEADGTAWHFLISTQDTPFRFWFFYFIFISVFAFAVRAKAPKRERIPTNSMVQPSFHQINGRKKSFRREK